MAKGMDPDSGMVKVRPGLLRSFDGYEAEREAGSTKWVIRKDGVDMSTAYTIAGVRMVVKALRELEAVTRVNNVLRDKRKRK